MGRKRQGKPWLRKSDNCYYTTIGRSLVKVGAAGDPPDKVQRAYHAALAGLETTPKTLTVQRIVREFLDFNKLHRAATTHEWYQGYLDGFIAFIKPSLAPDRLTPSTVDRWIETKYGTRAPSTRNGAARAVTRAMNWAISERLIDRSPLVGFTKPAASHREVSISQAQFQKCLLRASEPMKDVVTFLWHTGCRPQELRQIERRWIDGDRIVLPVSKSKGKKKHRVIYLNATAKEIAVRLAADNLYGPIFLNCRDKPWTKGSLICAFNRLKKKTNIEGLCAYALRHGFATETLKRGVDTTTVSVLMGNSPRMVAEVYQHVANDQSYLLSVVNAV